MAHRSKYNLFKMSEEEIRELMDSIPTDDKATDHEDQFESDDEDIAPPNIVTAEDELALTNSANCPEEVVEITSRNTEDNDSSYATAGNAFELPLEAQTSETEPSTSSTSSVRPSKRSKLPPSSELVEEEDGLNLSTTGRFVGDVTAIKNDSQEFKSMTWRKKIYKYTSTN